MYFQPPSSSSSPTLPPFHSSLLNAFIASLFLSPEYLSSGNEADNEEADEETDEEIDDYATHMMAGKRKRANPDEADKDKAYGLWVDFSSPESVKADLEVLQKRTRNHIVNADDSEADDAKCVSDPKEIMGTTLAAAPIDDLTAYAIMTCFPRREWYTNTKDFESARALRGTRPPRGLGVVIEAFGIRWVPLMAGRTLLLGAELGDHFPFLLRTERISGAATVEIGIVTIPPDWQEGLDYVVVARPSNVNMTSAAGTTLTDKSEAPEDATKDAAYANIVARNGGWPTMSMDPKKLVIIPHGDRKKHLVLPLEDVPGFRPTCSDPARTVDVNTAKDHIFAGYDDLAALPWTAHDPTTRRPTKVAKNVATNDPPKVTKDVATNDPPKVTKDVAKNDPQTPVSTPKKSTKVASDDQNGLIGDIYACVATKMGLPQVDRAAEWDLPTLSPEDTFGLRRESAGCLTGDYNVRLKNVAEAAGLINKHCASQGWTESQAVAMALPSTTFGDMVKKFTDASQSCHDLLSSERVKSWHTAALANYALVALQYPRLGANRQFRRPAIADMTAFLAINPRNKRPEPEPRQDEDDEDDESDELH